MSGHWWTAEQRFDAPDGSAFHRANAVLYQRPSGSEQFYEVASTLEFNPDGAACFTFTDKQGAAGKLTCSPSSCAVTYGSNREVQLTVRNGAELPPSSLRLYDYDHRQKPFAVYAARSVDRLVYLSSWVHSPIQVPDFVYLIRCNPGEPLDLSTPRELTDASIRNENFLTFEVENSHRLLHLTPRRTLDICTWADVGGHVSFELVCGVWQASDANANPVLEQYNITHDPNTGALVTFAEKRR